MFKLAIDIDIAIDIAVLGYFYTGELSHYK